MTERQHLSRHTFYEARFKRQFERQLKSQYSMLAFQYGKGQPLNVDTEGLEKVYKRMYKQIMAREGKLYWNTYVAVGRKDLIDDMVNTLAPRNAGDMAPFWSNMMDDFLLIYVAERVKKVGETSLKNVQRIIAKAEAENLTREEVKRLIQAENLAPRSLTIARTETTTAMGRSQTIALQSSGERWEKAWVNVGDERVRPGHMAMDPNHYIDINENFIVDGEQLDYPGSTNEGASLENVVRCRCWMEYRRVGGANEHRRIA